MSEIIADKIRLEFLSRCRQMAEECLQDSRCELREQEGEILGETIKELEQVIGPLAEKYWEKKEEGETGGLENIYLSFLRTGNFLLIRGYSFQVPCSSRYLRPSAHRS